MNNISSSVKNILQSVAEELEPKSMWKIIFPLIDEIETLQSTLEIVAEERKEYEKEAKGLKKRIEESEKNNKDTWDRIYKIRNIIESIKEGITIETLYGNIKKIGDLLNSDLSEQIEIIKTINGGFQEGRKEIITLREDKEKVEIKLGELQKIESAIEDRCEFLQRENNRKDNIIKSMEKNSTDLLMSNEELREKLRNLEDINKKLSDDLINQNGKVHMLEEEVDLLKSENERLNNQIIDLQMVNRQLQEDIFRRNEND